MIGNGISPCGSIETRRQLLHGWLQRRLTGEALAWLDGRIEAIRSGAPPRELATSIALAPRKAGKGALAPDAGEIADAMRVRPGLDPSQWSIDQTLRILLLLTAAAGDEEGFARLVDRLTENADLSEHVALLRGLPLYPVPERLVARACEGVRSAMQPVFEAVAHRSPYPREQFSEAQWNQMVLKALFVGSSLAPIEGLDDRRNADLAATLMDYVHERWAASRAVSPELWRCVGPFARVSDIADMRRVLRTGEDTEAAAVALALAECPRTEAFDVLNTVPALFAGIRNGQITWEQIT